MKKVINIVVSKYFIFVFLEEMAMKRAQNC